MAKGIFTSKDNANLDVIIDRLINNEEFLNKIAKKISRDYLNVEKECECDEGQQNVVEDTTETEEQQSWEKEVVASHCEEDNLEKYISEIEALNEEKIRLNQKIDKLIYENDKLIKEKNSFLEFVNELKAKNERQINILKNEKMNLENDLEELREKNKTLEYNLDALKNKYYEIKNSADQALEMKNRELQDKDKEIREKDRVILRQESKINDLQSEFSSIKESYNLFLSLNDEIRNDVVSILRGDKIENFVYAGVQYKNIESMWEYAKNRAINGQTEDLHKLEKIIINFLDAYNMIYNSPLYEVQKVETGDDFDEEKFIRGYESRIIGVISGVDLLGYVNLVNGKIVKKSVVRI